MSMKSSNRSSSFHSLSTLPSTRNVAPPIARNATSKRRPPNSSTCWPWGRRSSSENFGLSIVHLSTGDGHVAGHPIQSRPQRFEEGVDLVGEGDPFVEVQGPFVVRIDNRGVFVEEHTGGVDEAREGCKVVPVVAAIAPDVIAQRPGDRQCVAGSGQRHIQQAAFFLEAIAVGQ